MKERRVRSRSMTEWEFVKREVLSKPKAETTNDEENNDVKRRRRIEIEIEIEIVLKKQIKLCW